MIFRAVVACSILVLVWSQSGTRGGLKKPACLKTGDLCIPMLMRVFGSQYANEAYCCNTTCVPLMPPMYGMCSRFIPQIASPTGLGTIPTSIINGVQGLGNLLTGGSASSSSSSSPSSDSRNNFLYYV